MWDAGLCIVIIGGFFLLRAIFATIFFFLLIPEGDRCPNCDAVTLRVESRGWNFLLPRMRTSWCFECGWHGLLRIGAVSPSVATGSTAERRSPRAGGVQP
ncbi:MAG TPA: hypothetical protein VHB25_13105 [Gemmatimonadaceae bacterium]|nr:hypothetical protein [Gemmatimonadaceae bacterium]